MSIHVVGRFKSLPRSLLASRSQVEVRRGFELKRTKQVPSIKQVVSTKCVFFFLIKSVVIIQVQCSSRKAVQIT